MNQVWTLRVGTFLFDRLKEIERSSINVRSHKTFSFLPGVHIRLVQAEPSAHVQFTWLCLRRLIGAGAPAQIWAGRTGTVRSAKMNRTISYPSSSVLLFSDKKSHRAVRDERCARSRSSARRISPVAALAGRRRRRCRRRLFCFSPAPWMQQLVPVAAGPRYDSHSSGGGRCIPGARRSPGATPPPTSSQKTCTLPQIAGSSKNVIQL